MMTILTTILAGMIAAATPQKVDLGLPSGNLWADVNVEGVYAWGELETKESYTKDNYNVSGYDWFRDSRLRLDMKDDVARQLYGECWQIPSKDDWQELLVECKWETTNRYYQITGPNGNVLILPKDVTNCYYWCNDISGATGAVALCIENNNVYISAIDRHMGINVRAVYKEEKPVEPEKVTLVYANASVGYVILREFPTPKSKPLEKFYNDDAPAVLVGEFGQWWEVELDGEHGFVLKSLTRIEADADAPAAAVDGGEDVVAGE